PPCAIWPSPLFTVKGQPRLLRNSATSLPIPLSLSTFCFPGGLPSNNSQTLYHWWRTPTNQARRIPYSAPHSYSKPSKPKQAPYIARKHQSLPTNPPKNPP